MTFISLFLVRNGHQHHKFIHSLQLRDMTDKNVVYKDKANLLLNFVGNF